MFSFSIVKKIGEGKYLDEDLFIIERIRRERALNMRQEKLGTTKFHNRFKNKDGKIRPS